VAGGLFGIAQIGACVRERTYAANVPGQWTVESWDWPGY
jgi:hypothetical protein